MRGFHLKASQPSEKAVQAAVLQYLAYDPRVQWAARFNVGASQKEYVDRQGQSRRYFIRWAPEGTPDILGMLKGGFFLGIECKGANGRLRPQQQQFLAAIQAGDGLAIIARTVDDVVREINRFWQARQREVTPAHDHD